MRGNIHKKKALAVGLATGTALLGINGAALAQSPVDDEVTQQTGVSTPQTES